MAVIALLAMASPTLWTYGQALRYEERLASLRQEHGDLVKLWKEINNIEARQAALDEVPAFDQLELMAEIARHLPKNSWLIRYEAYGDVVELRGYSKNSADIIPALRQSERVVAVAFIEPTIRNEGKDRERFGIRVSLKGVDVESFMARYRP